MLELLALLGVAIALPFVVNELDDDDSAPATPGEDDDSGEGFEANDASTRSDLLDLVDDDWEVVPGTATGGPQSIYAGGAGPDTLVGEDGNDIFRDADGDAVMVGKDGNDRFVAGPGAAISGGEGADLFDLRPDTEEEHIVITDFEQGQDTLDRVILDTNAQTGDGLTKEVWADGMGANLYYADTLVASIVGGQDIDPQGIPLWLNATGGSFTDGEGDSVIRAWGTDQVIDGGGGDDTISPWLTPGETGADSFFGGAGDDVIQVLGPKGAIYNDGEGGTITIDQMPLADGGTGDDILVADGAAVLTGGAGADTFGIEGEVFYPEGYEVQPVQITDFEQGEDVIFIDDVFLENGESFVIERWEDGTGADILAGTLVVAEVTGGQDMTPDDVRSPVIDIRTDLLGHH